jgi:hypothetical protein
MCDLTKRYEKVNNKIRLKKFCFTRSLVKWLGRELTNTGIRMGKNKVQVVSFMP